MTPLLALLFGILGASLAARGAWLLVRPAAAPARDFAAPARPSGWERIMGAAPVEIVPAALAWVREGWDRAVRAGFSEADRSPVFTTLYVGLVFVVLPVLAFLNALIGGSPRLALILIAALAGLALLHVLGERSRGGPATGALAAGVFFAMLVAVPLYVSHSFADRLVREHLVLAALESVLVAPVIAAAVFSLKLAGDVLLPGNGPAAPTGRARMVVESALAAIPLAFVGAFVVAAAATRWLAEVVHLTWPGLAMTVGATAAACAAFRLGLAEDTTARPRLGVWIAGSLAALAAAWGLATAAETVLPSPAPLALGLLPALPAALGVGAALSAIAGRLAIAGLRAVAPGLADPPRRASGVVTLLWGAACWGGLAMLAGASGLH